MPTWPATLPQEPVYNPISGSGPDGAAIRTQNSKGQAKQRPRFTAAPQGFALEFAPLTAAQLSIFETWYFVELKMGALSFDMPHPITDAISIWRFVAGGANYNFKPIGKDAFQLNLTSLELLP